MRKAAPGIVHDFDEKTPPKNTTKFIRNLCEISQKVRIDNILNPFLLPMLESCKPQITIMKPKNLTRECSG